MEGTRFIVIEAEAIDFVLWLSRHTFYFIVEMIVQCSVLDIEVDLAFLARHGVPYICWKVPYSGTR